MKWRGAMGLLSGCIVALSVTACGSADQMHYKMIVEVETPEGLKTGYSVREIRYAEPSDLPSIGESRPQWRVTGEAVAIDLPGGRTLFALLSSGDGQVDFAGRDIWFLFREFGRGWPTQALELWPRVPHARSQRISDPLPMLVTFRDIADPKSVEAVEPEAFEAAFSPGTRLRRISVEQTNESVTLGIDKRLRWLSSQRGSLDYTGRLHPDNREKDVTDYAFWQGRSN